MRIPFGEQSYQSQSTPVLAQRCVNWVPQIEPQEAFDRIVLYPTPGLKAFATAGDGPIHGVHVMNGTLYAVSGDTLYSISAGGTATSLGTIVGNNRVSMADNGTELVIVNGTKGYVYDTTNGLQEITDPDFNAADTVTFQDSYLIFNWSGTGKFFISALNDATAYDALDFATAEGAPDDTLAVFSDHRELWLFGEKTIEVWYNSGNVDFPFERIEGAFIERGLLASQTIARLDNTLFWVGDDRIVYRANGYTPARISHHGVEQAIQGYSTVSDAFAYGYYDEGHVFYVLTFPTENATWVFDVASNRWHERLYWNGSAYKRHRSNCYARAYDKHLVGDFENGQIYELDHSTYDDDGDTIKRLVDSPPVHGNGRRLRMPSLEVHFEEGVGLTTSQGSDPQAMLQWSDNGGRTFGSEHWRDIGKVGKYRQRAIWRKLGWFRERQFRLVVSDPVNAVIRGNNAEIL